MRNRHPSAARLLRRTLSLRYSGRLLPIVALVAFVKQIRTNPGMRAAYEKNIAGGGEGEAPVPNTRTLSSGWRYLERLPPPDRFYWPDVEVGKRDAVVPAPGDGNEMRPAMPPQLPTLTTGVPALYRGLRDKMPDLLRSVAGQVVRPDEVVAVVSQFVNATATTSGGKERAGGDEGSRACRELHEWMRRGLDADPANVHPNNVGGSPEIPLRLLCVGDRMTPGRARNAVGRLASGDVVAYVDADDMELADRTAVLKQQFGCVPARRLILSLKMEDWAVVNRTKAAVADRRPEDYRRCDNLPRVREGGRSLRDWADKTHERLYLRITISHGHMAVHRSVLKHVSHTSRYVAEDVQFIRDVIYHYADNDDAVVIINKGLTTYFQPGNTNQDLKPFNKGK